MSNKETHIIGSYTGTKHGPLIICLGGIHGNEPAGVRAIATLLKMLDDEPNKNPDFRFRGRMVGLKCNIPALKRSRRYIDEDLNRMWLADNVNRIAASPPDELNTEERVLKELNQIIHAEVAAYAPEQIVVLDIHTTTASGGVFTIVPDDEKALELAARMKAPVVTEMNKGIFGTTMDYFKTNLFARPCFCLAFEAGQHEDPKASDMAIAGMVSGFRALGCIKPEDVESKHDKLLSDYSAGLPPVSEMLYKYEIGESEQFVMRPGYHNFQKVKRGEVLAQNEFGPITSREDGLILMPHYQKAGNDGFFIVRALDY